MLDKGYLGGGNTGRNTAIVRSNYLTLEGVTFYDESVRLCAGPVAGPRLNLFYSERGHFTLAHTDGTLRTMRWRAEVNKHLGVEQRGHRARGDPQDLSQIDLTCGGHAADRRRSVPSARRDRPATTPSPGPTPAAADRRGVEIHQQTAVTGIDVADGQVVGVQTEPRASIKTTKVLSAVAGYTPRITKMVGLRTPLVIQPLQACVTEPLKPWLDQIVVSASLHIYVSQSSRGELVMGASLDPYELHSERSTLDFVEGLSDHLLDLFPFLSDVKVKRQWAGMSDMTPDFSPIMGTTPVEGFYLDAGWGTWGFKATPVCGTTMAYTVANDADHELIRPFNLSRFRASIELSARKGAAVGGALEPP